MSLVSVMIPSRNEQFLKPTVEDVFAKASGEIEVVVVLDGYWPAPALQDDKRLAVLHRGAAQGMRPALNAAAHIAQGEYLMKLDAHCMVSEGFDERLKGACEDNWVVVPRRYPLDAEKWQRGGRTMDYHYLGWPFVDERDPGMHGRWWRERQEERKHIEIDDEMTSQGSSYFMSRKWWERLDGLHSHGYGDFMQEFQEVGCKTWLGGGEVKINKRCWYAHLHKGKKYGRGYFLSKRSWHDGARYSADFWVNNRWPERKHDFEWLLERFWPVPTWPEDWRERDYSRLAA